MNEIRDYVRYFETNNFADYHRQESKDVIDKQNCVLYNNKSLNQVYINIFVFALLFLRIITEMAAKNKTQLICYGIRLSVVR